MAHYIDKDALVAEIEKLYNGEIDTYTRNILDRLKSNIDTLEVKEILDEYDGALGKELKMVDDEIARLEKLKVKEVDLEEEINNVWKKDFSGHFDVIGYTDFTELAKHFFELGRAVSNKAQKGEKK